MGLYTDPDIVGEITREEGSTLKEGPNGKQTRERPNARWWNRVGHDIRGFSSMKRISMIESFGSDVLLRPTTNWCTNGHDSKQGSIDVLM